MTQDLIERLEGAEAGSRELDAQVWLSATGEVPDFPFEQEAGPYVRYGKGFFTELPAVTTSLDAALALAERVLPRWSVGLQIDPLGTLATLSHPDVDTGAGVVVSASVAGHDEIDGEAKTAPLALCIALLRAHREGER